MRIRAFVVAIAVAAGVSAPVSAVNPGKARPRVEQTVRKGSLRLDLYERGLTKGWEPGPAATVSGISKGPVATDGFSGATAFSYAQSDQCLNGRQFGNSLNWISTSNVGWAAGDTTELVPGGLLFEIPINGFGQYSISLTGSATVPGGDPGTSVFFGAPMSYPDALIAFCEIWAEPISGGKISDCPVLKTGTLLVSQTSDKDFTPAMFQSNQVAAHSESMGVPGMAGLQNLSPGSRYRLRIGVAGEGSISAPIMQFCSWHLMIETR